VYLENVDAAIFSILSSDSDYFESLPPWQSVSMTGVAEPAPSDTVDGTIRLNHYESVVSSSSPSESGEYISSLTAVLM
jgi:hypothetical protein